MKMSSFLLILGLALGGLPVAAGTVGAQDSVDRPQADRLERKLQHLRQRLELNDEQVAMIRPVLEEAHARRRALRAMPREERRGAMRELKASVRHQLEGILNPEQMERFETMIRRGPFGRGRRMNPERMIERMREHLELSDAQVTRIRPILDRAAERRRSIRELDRPDRREAARALRNETMDAVRSELTDGQRVEFDAFREEMRHRRHHRRGHR